MAALQRYPWPGNIRELRNVVERAMIIADGPASDDRRARDVGAPRRKAQRSCSSTWRRNTSAACSRAPAGAFAAPAARPSGSGFGRRRSRRAWPSSASNVQATKRHQQVAERRRLFTSEARRGPVSRSPARASP